MQKRLIVLSMICVFLINIFIQVVYAALPDFAVVESNSNNVEAKYKTAESSVQTAATPTFTFQSAAQILMESTTGEIIYANNENERLLPASVTKVMTLLLIMDEIDNKNLKYDDTVTCSLNASKLGGSQIWFKEGETLTIDEALKCICVVSANDVCVAMAEKIAGTEENFVARMNERAKGLGMGNTNFMNCHGIDEDGHYTTAKDIALMSKELITKHPDIYKYTTIWMDSIRGGTFDLANTNKLLKTYEGLTGLKTGSTSKAGFNLSATAERNGLSLIAVVLKAPTSAIRNDEVTNLLNYGFSAYTSKKLGTKGDLIESINISKNVETRFKIVLKKDEYLVTKKGENKEYITVITYNENLKAPVEKGTVVGTIKYIDNEGNILHEGDIIINETAEKSSLWKYIIKIVSTYGIKDLKEQVNL